MTNTAADNELVALGPTALAPFAESPDEALAEIFGHTSFRHGQRRVIDELLDGRDAVVVMPTGAGKSLCYQLAGALVDGVTLVVSPLIALMKDQVDALEQSGLPATTIHSGISWRQQRRRINHMYLGDYKLVYVAPERFRSRRFCNALEDVQIGLFAVDEAHCISQWGHDFRPAYRKLDQVRRRFGEPLTVALTATATERVRGDIVEQLGIEDAEVVTTGFERPNLCFEVVRTADKDEKIERMAAVIDHWEGESILVYGSTRKQVRSVASRLDQIDIDAAAYHAGMSDADRREVHDRWSSGELPVIVATTAFGMGVDKADVRAVIHYNMPGSVEAYYQQAGRAGRDGRPANCVLLFNHGDTGIHEWFAEHTHPLRMELIRVWLYLRELGVGEHETTAKQISQANPGPGDQIHSMAVDTCLTLLARAGHIRRSGGVVEVLEDVEPLELDIEFSRFSKRRRIAKEQISAVVDYATSSGCLQRVLVEHFDAEPQFGTRCGHCANCDPLPDYVRSQQAALARGIRCDAEPCEVLRRVLTGVADADGRRGVSTVAAMLVGSRARRVQDAGFDGLDSHGGLEELAQKDVAHLIELAARHGLVRRSEHDCPLLTSRGVDVMRGGEPSEALAEELERDFGII